MSNPAPGLLAMVHRNFTYHPPKPDQIPHFETVRSQAMSLATTLLTNCPMSRELSLALTKLEEVVMWANAAIARNERGGTSPTPDTPLSPPDSPLVSG